MGENWEQITSDLYNKINPIGGRICSQIDSSFIYKKRLGNVWLEFDMNDFEYIDPFYGQQKSTSLFKIEVNLWDYIEPINITNIRQIEDLTLNCDIKDRIGVFSNSLHFTVPLLQFGKVYKNEIKVFLEYCLTNSDSYGYMTGKIEDHIQAKGRIEVDLTIKELQLLAQDLNEARAISENLTKDVYNVEAIKEATDLNWSSPNYNCYYVPYKN